MMKTAQDSYTITIKQIVRFQERMLDGRTITIKQNLTFQERMHLEKFRLDKIQNGRLSTIIHLDRPVIADIIKTAQDSYTITIKQIVSFQKRMHLKKFQVDKFHNGRLSAIIHSTGLILRNIMKTAQDSYTITIKQNVRFQERMHFEKIQLDQDRNSRLSAIIHLDRPDVG